MLTWPVVGHFLTNEKRILSAPQVPGAAAYHMIPVLLTYEVRLVPVFWYLRSTSKYQFYMQVHPDTRIICRLSYFLVFLPQRAPSTPSWSLRAPTWTTPPSFTYRKELFPFFHSSVLRRTFHLFGFRGSFCYINSRTHDVYTRECWQAWSYMYYSYRTASTAQHSAPAQSNVTHAFQTLQHRPALLRGCLAGCWQQRVWTPPKARAPSMPRTQAHMPSLFVQTLVHLVKWPVSPQCRNTVQQYVRVHRMFLSNIFCVMPRYSARRNHPMHFNRHAHYYTWTSVWRATSTTIPGNY